MKFNVKNYPNLNKITSKKLNIDKFDILESKKNFKILNLSEIINDLNNNDLNNNDLLNIKSKAEISIIFEDFTWFGKIKNQLNNFISKALDKENLENSIAHYDSQSKSIHIFNGIVEPKTNHIEFKENYNNLINVNKRKAKYHLMIRLLFKIKRVNRKN